MSNLKAQEFINKIETDPEFRLHVGIYSNTMSLDEFKTIAAAVGCNYSSEEIAATNEAKRDDSLSEEELEQVTGGTGKASGTSGQIYLVFKFKLVAVKTISW